MSTKAVPTLKTKPTGRAKTGTKENITTKHAEESRSMMLSWPNSALSFIAAALSKLYCKPSQEEWLKTPEQGNESGQFYDACLMVDDKPGDKQQLIDLTRDEVIELKHHLAFLRRIRPYEKP
jgi:hypothetical protein